MKYEFLRQLCKNMEAGQFFAQTDKHQDFINTIETAILQIIEAPEQWPVEGQIRRYIKSV